MTELVRQLEELTTEVQQVFNSIFEGFLQHKASSLEQADQHRVNAEKLIKDLTGYVLAGHKENKQDIDRAAILELLGAVEQINYAASKITGSVSQKIKDSVLFSDKAVTELRDTFGTVMDCLKQITDLVITGNRVIADYLTNKVHIYSKVVKDYATEHEDRLIRGDCLPKSSIIYLTILDALNDALWNIKKIGEAFKDK